MDDKLERRIMELETKVYRLEHIINELTERQKNTNYTIEKIVFPNVQDTEELIKELESLSRLPIKI
jgi:uncharacterized coiled-coil protein SlyX